MGTGSIDATRLQLLILQEHFGSSVHKVAKVLAGTVLSLRQISEEAEMTLAAVRQTMTVLLQHDLASYTKPSKEGPRAGPNMYRLESQNILLRARIPRILEYAEQQYGEITELIVREVLLHGQIQLPSIIASIKQQTDQITDDQVFLKFKDLVRNRLIMRRMDPDTEAIERDDDPELSVRFEIPPELEGGGTEGRAGKRPKLESDDPDAYFRRRGGEGNTYWGVNFNQFLRCFFLKWAVEMIRVSVDPEIAKVFQGLVEACLLDSDYQGSLSQAIDAGTLKDNLPAEISSSQLYGQFIQTLLEFGGQFVVSTGTHLQINYKKIAEVAQMRSVEHFVETKHGQGCARIFRLVVEHKMVEQKQVKELALIGVFKEVKAHLNTLFRAQLLKMQECPKGADRTPQKCWYFWTCDMHRVVTMLVDQCYQTQANLQVRAMAIRAESTVLKKKIDLARADEDNMEDADRARLAAGEAKLTKMHASLNKLETLATQIDGQLMMLRDFNEFHPDKLNWHRI